MILYYILHQCQEYTSEDSQKNSFTFFQFSANSEISELESQVNVAERAFSKSRQIGSNGYLLVSIVSYLEFWMLSILGQNFEWTSIFKTPTP